MNRRILTVLAALVPVIVLGVLGSVVSVPFVALGPGPTFNTLSEVDGKQVVDITGTAVDPTTGNLNMTTVSVPDQISIFEAFGFWASGRHGLVPRAEVYPPEKSKEEIDEGNKADFQDSESKAETAALAQLKMNFPVGLQVGNVSDDGPAKDALKRDDQLISINDVPVQTVRNVQDAVAAVKPQSDLTVKFRRGGKDETAVVKVGARPDDNSKGYLGVTPVEKPLVPFDVDFNLADIGGPSAGLMFSLAVVDKLSPGELSGGKFIAGTGTIEDSGEVGPIGGIPYKMIAAREAGATTFLVPAKNCDEARQQAPDGLLLVKVDKLADAVTSLEKLRSGGTDLPSCG